MVEKKGGGGGVPPTLRECTGDAQCCRRSGGHTRQLLLNNPKLQSEVSIFILFSRQQQYQHGSPEGTHACENYVERVGESDSH